ncbi:hypothetical protein HELRODRAFT_164088 [Helobdella robusta]|uniref:Uncharacterized protein n=1 Tax=Helobdella robusta TaxID=6412 RepID=T1EUW7_HELRO|nr:hypothetical protein HELRODRAFT_164088 [Helobdella robusta]ESN94277.1 hypothetical protein HELRODRAFT_164088 [Helobdella robusta]
MKNPPFLSDIDSFWRQILENDMEHNRNADWIKGCDIDGDCRNHNRNLPSRLSHRCSFVCLCSHCSHKLVMPNDYQLKKALTILNNFSCDIQMKFRLDKCATLIIRRGAVVRSSGINVDQDIRFRVVDAEETYRYFGMEEAEGVQQQMMKKQFKKNTIVKLN